MYVCMYSIIVLVHTPKECPAHGTYQTWSGESPLEFGLGSVLLNLVRSDACRPTFYGPRMRLRCPMQPLWKGTTSAHT